MAYAFQEIAFKQAMRHGIFIVLVARWIPGPEKSREIIGGHLNLSASQPFSSPERQYQCRHKVTTQEKDTYSSGSASNSSRDIIGQRNDANTGWFTPRCDLEELPLLIGGVIADTEGLGAA